MAKLAADKRRIWMGIALALAIVALMGPWAFDRINVPAQYECTRPNVRLEGDFCGMPVTGLWVLMVTIQAVRGLPAAWLRGEPGLSGGFPEIFLAGIPLLLVLPIITAIVRIWRSESRRWAVINLFAWGLSFIVAGWIFVAGIYERWIPFGVWGVWLYVAAAFFMMAVDIHSLIRANRANLP